MSRSARWVAGQLWIDVWNASAGFLANSILGSQPIPRVLRGIGYKLLGVRTRTWNIFPGLTFAGRLRNVTVGPGTFFNRDCFIEATAEVEIGADCQFGPQVMILTSHHPREADGSVSKRPQNRPVRIGRGAWIGARAVLVPGVTVGENVVIAAGAVVSRDCLEPGVYGGIPARALTGARPTPDRHREQEFPS